MKQNADFLIFIDDTVFLQHAIGLIYMLITKMDYKIEIAIADKVDQTVLAYQLLKAFEKDSLIIVNSMPSKKKYARIFSQWGPPPSYVRTYSKIRRNTLAFKFRGLKGKWICLPHGFEIKHDVLNITKKSKVRSMITNLSLNPYIDYRFYHRYSFDTATHKERYHNLLDGITTPILGSMTFNTEILNVIKKQLEIDWSYDFIVIMPKQRHVEQINDIFINYDKNTMFVPHPREYQEQLLLLKKYGVHESNIIHTLDLLRFDKTTVVYDFGTSVSLFAKVSGATLHFNNLTNKELLVDPTNRSKVEKLLRGECGSTQTYDDFILQALIDDIL